MSELKGGNGWGIPAEIPGRFMAGADWGFDSLPNNASMRGNGGAWFTDSQMSGLFTGFLKGWAKLTVAVFLPSMRMDKRPYSTGWDEGTPGRG